MKKLTVIVVLLFACAVQAQVLTLSTNPKSAPISQDQFINGGSLTLTFDKDYSSSYRETPRLIITLDRADILFDEMRPPTAFKNSWNLNTLNVVATPYQVEIILDPRMYGEPFHSVSIYNFTLDLYQLNLAPGTKIDAQVHCTDPAVTIVNPTFRLFSVARAAGRR